MEPQQDLHNRRSTDGLPTAETGRAVCSPREPAYSSMFSGRWHYVNIPLTPGAPIYRRNGARRHKPSILNVCWHSQCGRLREANRRGYDC